MEKGRGTSDIVEKNGGIFQIPHLQKSLFSAKVHMNCPQYLLEIFILTFPLNLTIIHNICMHENTKADIFESCKPYMHVKATTELYSKGKHNFMGLIIAQ